MTDRRIKGRPLTDLLDTAAELEALEQQRRELDARMQALHRSQGENLRAVRMQAGMTMGDLASSLGTSKSYISQVENGVRGASSRTLFRFCSTISTAASGAGETTWEEHHGNESDADSTQENTAEEVGSS